jgi:hypothetical protein
VDAQGGGPGNREGGGADRISVRPAPPFLCRGVRSAAGRQEPDVGPLLEPDGGVPVGAPDRLPMLGQFLVEPDPELALEPELPVLEPDDGVVVDEPDVEEFAVELVLELPELPVVVDVVAALATSAPPARRPEVNAPTARTLRRRICMADVTLSSLLERRPVRAGTPYTAPRICVQPQSAVGGYEELPDERMTIHSNVRFRHPGDVTVASSGRDACAQMAPSARADGCAPAPPS